jgi:hypothetical protein
MGSKLEEESSFIVSTDVGVVHAKIQSVTGYDVDDIVRDKAQSLCRAIQMLVAGKMVDPTAPVGARTIPSVWLNNDEELPS